MSSRTEVRNVRPVESPYGTMNKRYFLSSSKTNGELCGTSIWTQPTTRTPVNESAERCGPHELLRDSRFSLRISAIWPGCAVCEQRIPSLIQGAHLISHSDGGKDAVGNGLPLCANHHLAMDNQLWAVNPQTFDLTFHIPKEKLGITRDSIAHLDRMPDSKCLEYVWDKFHATAAK